MTPIFDFTSVPVLETERLRLRPLSHNDADGVMAIFGSPEVLRYLNLPPTDTREKAIGLIDWLAGNFQRQEGIDWGITLRGENDLIGLCGAYAWERGDCHVDLGYHILPGRWGQGYATEAARAVIGWCFDNLDVHRIQADCTDGNQGSEAVLLKCGFRVEGIARESCWEHGRFVDIKHFGLLRREFEQPANIGTVHFSSDTRWVAAGASRAMLPTATRERRVPNQQDQSDFSAAVAHDHLAPDPSTGLHPYREQQRLSRR